MRPSGSLPGTEKRESLGLVIRTRGQRFSLVSTKEMMSWSTAINRYLQKHKLSMAYGQKKFFELIPTKILIPVNSVCVCMYTLQTMSVVLSKTIMQGIMLKEVGACIKFPVNSVIKIYIL